MAIECFRAIRVCSILVTLVFFATTSSTNAAGFRIETKVFVGEEKEKQEPVSETTTLFLDGTVYDFLLKPQQTAVFRKPVGGNPGEFTLLSDEHSIKTKISTVQLAGLIKKVQSISEKHADPFLQFAANPQFDESFKDGKLVLASHFENYTVTTKPSDYPDAMTEYKEFLDWYTKLNTLLSGSRLPPGPRLKLNAVLARHKVVPLKVELAREGEEPIRAEHEFNWRISQDDHRQIDNLRESLTTFQEVSNDEYRRRTSPKEAAK